MEPILTTLVTGMGTAIAKGALKRWLKDYPEALGATGAVADVLGTVAKDLIAKRKGARQFEDIAEKVAEDAFEVVESTGVELNSTQQTVVVDVAGEVLNRCVSDPEFGATLLAQHSLEPGEISRWFEQRTVPPVEEWVTPADDPTRGFNDGQRTLYERLLYDAAQYIVDLGSQFPSFTERTLSEVLKREDQIIGKADLILEEVRRIRSEMQTDSATEAAFEEKYRRAVIRRLDQLQLFGVDVASTSKRYRLSVAYVTLLVERQRDSATAPSPPAGGEGRGEGASVSNESPTEDDDIDDRETVPVDKALASTARLFVRGPAGSGKTTLLQWVAVMSASRSMKGELAEWNSRVPFFIKLREFASKDLPLASTFPILIDREALVESLPRGWVQQQLESGRALVLIDGLDEMPHEKREAVRLWIDSLVAEYPQSRFVVTSRPYAAEEGWLTSEGFLDAELQDMTTPDVHAFIGHWHEAVKEGVQTVEEQDELDVLNTSLLAAVKSNRAIHRLATSPLLCAMLCALHRERNEDLPTRRTLLYQACIDVFFRRDRERRISFEGYCEIKDDRQKQVLLADLAYWMLRNGWSMISLEDADSRLERALRRLRDELRDVTGEAARRLFAERVGILRYPEPGQIDFPHRTFLEYLAADAALDEGDIGELVKNAADDQWAETILLAAGLATAPDAERLVLGISKAGDPGVVARVTGATEHRARLYLMAARCLDAVVKIPEGSKLEAAVSERVEKVVPPRTMAQATELARAGDFALPYLEFDEKWNQRTLNACTRTVSLIGSEAALARLKEYISDSEVACGESWASWKYAPDAEAHLCVMNPGFDGETLSLGGLPVSDVSPLAQLTSLQTLELYNTKVSDVSPLSQLTCLQTLHLGGMPVSDVSPLVQLTGLRELYLQGTSVSDVSALSQLTSLQTLDLGGTKVSHVNPLAHLVSLQTLDLSGTNVSHVSWAAHVASLQTLYLNGTQVSDLSALSQLASLQTLDLHSTKVSDLSPLAHVASLQTLHLDNTQVSDLSPLAQLTSLQTLDLNSTQVSDVSPLAELTSLQTLYLNSTKVSDVSPLAQLTSLQTLCLYNTPVSDVSPLAQLTSLQALYLYNTPVSDVSPLAQLTSLQALWLSGTKVSDVSPLAQLTSLQTLDLSGTAVSDVSPLAQLTSLQMLWLSGTKVSDEGVEEFRKTRKRAGLTEVEIVR